MRAPRDLMLLDRLEEFQGVKYSGPAWRVAKEGLDPTQGYSSGSRWDPGTFDVLYTSLEASGAISEMRFHLSSQPVFPSKVKYELSELKVGTNNTLKLFDTELFDRLNVSKETYSTFDYGRTQEIGDAAQFLGFDGLIVPSARSSAQNLVLFSDKFGPENIALVASQTIVWEDWD